MEIDDRDLEDVILPLLLQRLNQGYQLKDPVEFMVWDSSKAGRFEQLARNIQVHLASKKLKEADGSDEDDGR